MTKQSYNHILKFVFCAFALIMLSACGGGGGAGDEGVPEGGGNVTLCIDGSSIGDCSSGDENAVCDPDTHFCDTTEARRSACEPATHDCGENNQGSGRLTCNDSERFCFTTDQVSRGAACDARVYDCDGTGERLACNDREKFCNTDDQIVRADCAALATHDCETGLILPPCDPLTTTHDCKTGELLRTAPDGTDLITGYSPPSTETPPTGGWRKALADARTPEYQASGGADRIGAAYAHARGYTGAINGNTDNPVTVSMIGGLIDRDHTDLLGQLVQGYQVDGVFNDRTAGTCGGAAHETNGRCSSTATDSTYLPGIIAGKSGNGGIQGIAYNAKIKPIQAGIYTGSNMVIEQQEQRKRSNAIIRASSPSVNTYTSGPNISVIHNNWYSYGTGSWSVRITDDNGVSHDTSYHYRYPVRFGSNSNEIELSNDEKEAWISAVGTAVLVFPQGYFGQNSENGQVALFNKSEERAYARDVAWATLVPSNENLGGTFANLPTLVPEIQGKSLFVIALDENNVIHKHSNGCGTAKTYCLGAPGADMTTSSVVPSLQTIDTQSGTTLAAAHVSGAIAVLKGAFPHLTPTQLVSLILSTADNLGILGVDEIYGHGALNLARASEPVTVAGEASITAFGNQRLGDARIDNSGITLPTSFGGALDGLKAGFTDDYDRAFIGNPSRITQASAAFTLGDTLATWDSPELQSITLDSNSKMQFTNYDASEDAKDTLIFTHNLPNHTIGFSYNEEHKTPDLMLAGAGNTGDEMHFQKILPIANDLMQLNSTYKLGKSWNVKNALTSGEFDTGNRFNEAMANLNYTGENHQLTIGAGTLKEYGQFLGASGTGAYQLSDATSSQVTHLAVTQNLPRNSKIKLKYTSFKTEVDMRYNNFANINDLTANEYQLSLTKKQLFGKSDSLNIELIQPFAVTDGTLQQSTVLGYNETGDYNNVTQNYNLAPTNRRQQIRMTWQNQLNNLKSKTRFFISVQYDKHVNNLRDNEDSQILGGISTKF